MTAGVLLGTAQAAPPARLARNEPSGCDSVIVSVLPRATTPLSPWRLSRDVIVVADDAAERLANGEFSCGLATRSMVALNVCAVTASFEGGEKRKPDRIVKLYVLPPSVGVGTASATSGTICDPAGAGLSG